MKPVLKEDPREWQKFTLVASVAVAVLSSVLTLRRILPLLGLLTNLLFLATVLVACLLRPAWFRGFYRGGMFVSFHVGQFMGKVFLVAIFLMVVTPLGLVLRLFGKDLLKLKRLTGATSYWRPGRNPNKLDQMF